MKLSTFDCTLILKKQFYKVEPNRIFMSIKQNIFMSKFATSVSLFNCLFLKHLLISLFENEYMH